MRGLRLLLTATTAILGALADSSIATGAPKDAPPGGTEAVNDALHPWNVGVVHPWNMTFNPPQPPKHKAFVIRKVDPAHAEIEHAATQANADHLKARLAWTYPADYTVASVKEDLDEYALQFEHRTGYAYSLFYDNDDKTPSTMVGAIYLNRPDFADAGHAVPHTPNTEWPGGARSADLTFWTAAGSGLDEPVMQMLEEWIGSSWPIDTMSMTVLNSHLELLKLAKARGWHEHVVHPSVAHIMDGPSEDQTLVWKKPGFEVELTKLPEAEHDDEDHDSDHDHDHDDNDDYHDDEHHDDEHHDDEHHDDDHHDDEHHDDEHHDDEIKDYEVLHDEMLHLSMDHETDEHDEHHDSEEHHDEHDEHHDENHDEHHDEHEHEDDEHDEF